MPTATLKPTLVKPSGKPELPEQAETVLTPALGDELGRLNEEIDASLLPLKVKQDRVKVLEGLAKKLVPGPDGASLFEQDQTDFGTIVGPKNEASEINLGLVWKKGPKAALQAGAKFTQEFLKAVLDSELMEKVITKKRTGPRTVTTYRKVKAAA